MKILVIEDQPIDSKLAVHVLAAAGHDVERAAAAEAALEAIKADPPHLVLLDLLLPGVDGLTLARKLKDDPVTRGIPIVAVTSYPGNFTRDEVLAAGCDAFLEKPLSTRSLPAMLSDIAARRPAR